MSECLHDLPWNRPNILCWIILFFASVADIFLGGKRRAFGSFVAVFHVNFKNISLSELNWIGDTYSATSYLTTSFSIMVILYFQRRYCLFQFIGAILVLVSCVSTSFVPNPHWMFLTFTLIDGVGSSVIIGTVCLIINEYFDIHHPYRLLATTLLSGGPIAGVIFIPVYAVLIHQFTWRMAFIILGLMYFCVNGLSACFFRRKFLVTEELQTEVISFQCVKIRSSQVPLLVLWFIDRVITDLVSYGLLLNLTDYVHRRQTNIVKSTSLTTAYSAGEATTYILGLIITATTKNLFRNKLRYILLSTTAILSISLIVLEFVNDRTAKHILCYIAGLSIGPSVSLLFPAGEEMTLLPGHVAYPFTLCGMGLGMLISPLFTAKIAESFQYKWFFLVLGCLILIKLLCLLSSTLLLFYYEKSRTDKKYIEILSHSDTDSVKSLKETTQLIVDSSKK